MKRLHSEIEISATPARVWTVLTDLARYREWNPFIVEAQGPLHPGAELRMKMAPPGARRVTVRPTITAVTRERLLEWWGHVGVRGVFDGRHRFELYPSAAGTRLVQAEAFTGRSSRSWHAASTRTRRPGSRR